MDLRWDWIHSLKFESEINTNTEEKAIIYQLANGDPDRMEIFDELKNLSTEDLRKAVFGAKQSALKELPDSEVTDIERRQKKIKEQAKLAPGRQKEKRLRSVTVNVQKVKEQSMPYLRALYTKDGITICQICKSELPFKKKDGEYYFEAVELFPELTSHHLHNYISLCPLHSAMFSYANESENLFNTFVESDGQYLPLTLAGQSLELYFNKKHQHDLFSVIEVELEIED